VREGGEAGVDVEALVDHDEPVGKRRREERQGREGIRYKDASVIRGSISMQGCGVSTATAAEIDLGHLYSDP
jgi:hypothetical protein